MGPWPQIEPLLAGALGLLVGLVSALAFRWSEHSSRTVPPQPVPDVDAGVSRVLSVLRSAAMVVDDQDRVVRATAASHALGLVRDGALTHPALRDLVAQVRRDGLIEDVELDLPRGPMSTAALRVSVRVAAVTSDLVLVLADDLT
ncbi:MAG: two-component sensor histidine kinase, partial [Cellulomonas sp.]|nr:two-component sensor histidine kinase [Cellulomonas sp.]